MIWPTSTPQGLLLPKIGEISSTNDYTTPDRPVHLTVSRAGYLIAVISRTSLYLFRIKPLVPVAVYKRSDSSLDSHGDNNTTFFRPDGHVVGITTTSGAVLTFQILTQNSPSEVLKWERQDSHGSLQTLGPGEAIGAQQVGLRFRMLLKVTSGIADMTILDANKLMIATRSPPALQLIKMAKEMVPATVFIADIDWAHGETSIWHLTNSRAMSLTSITFESGNVYLCSTPEIAEHSGLAFSHGHKFHHFEKAGKGEQALMSAINARFSVISVGCERGTVYIYNIRDLNGSIQQVRRIQVINASAGKVTCLEWSEDGSALFVGYETGWAIYSVYGMLLSSSFLSNVSQVQRESWLGGIWAAAWMFAGDSVLMIAADAASGHFWQLGMAKWNGANNFSSDNLERPILFDDNRILLYRGAEQSDLTTIDRDALLWLSASVPVSYMAENWPVQSVSASADGRYVAVAGIRGFTHYSLNSGRWKLFSEDYMDREFTVRGGILWFGKYIIAAVDTEHYSHEVRVYSRESDLDAENVVFTIEFTSPILRSCIIGDLLVLYTADNLLYFYRIEISDGNFALEILATVSLEGLVHSPARVRILGGTSREQSERRSSAGGGPHSSRMVRYGGGVRRPSTGGSLQKSLDVKSVVLYLLTDGILTHLEPTENSDKQLAYTKKVLHHNVEYYHITQISDGSSILWAFDGQDMLAWPQFEACSPVEGSPYRIPVDSYPLSILVDKGIFAGIEAEPVITREKEFTYFKHWTTTQLFIPYLLEQYLRSGLKARALALAREYDHLKYFTHVLEMLLFRVLESEAVDDELHSDPSPLLRDTAELVCQFPQRLEVILGSTRKTEVKYWSRLFNVIGSPQELFEHCVSSGSLRTAAGFLLILHNLENFEQRKDNTERLFKLAYDSGDFELCCDLSRFLTAVDPTIETLRKTLVAVGVMIPELNSTTAGNNSATTASSST